MAAVDLGLPPLIAARPIPMAFGGVQRSDFGGASQYVAMLGDRWAFAFETAMMEVEPLGREMLVDLTRGRREGVIVRIVQPDFPAGAPGAPTVRTATVAGRTIPIEGATPNCVLRKGIWLNYFDALGRPYLDQTTAEVVTDGDGEADLPIQNLLRAPLAEGSAIELAEPRIRGSIEGEFGGGWGLDPYTSFSFVVSEER